jgi:DNA helicase-2/ATP-dependent DNA helicase PcrA
MEEMDAKDLMRHADAISASTGVARARAVVDFACSCMSGVATALATIRKRLAEGAFPDKARLKNHVEVVHALEEVARSEGLAPVDAAIAQLSAIEGTHVYRRELRSEMVRALTEHALGGHRSLKAAAWHVRNLRRHIGRSTDLRSVSRTLLDLAHQGP